MTPQEIEKIEKTINTYMGRAKFAGLGVGIIANNELVYAKGFGFANIEKQVPVTPETVFRIASTSKIVAAVALMQLYEQGRFQLDDPANDHLQTFQLQKHNRTDPPITVKHLLTHTAGLGEPAPFLSYIWPRLGGVGWPTGRPLPSLGRYYGNRLRPDSPPEAKWAYANHGFATVGQLVADLSAEPLGNYRSFAEHVRKNLFEPVGMFKSDFLRRPPVTHDLATGYTIKKDQPKPIWFDVDLITQADSSLFTTLTDFGQLMTSLLKGQILKPETLDLMWEPHFQLDEHLPAMGLGFFRENWPSAEQTHRVVGHNGAWVGFRSSMWLAPDAKYGVFAFTNTGSDVVISLAKNLLRDLLNVRSPQEGLPDLPPQPELLRELVGEYEPYPGWKSNLRLWLYYGARLTVYTSGDNLYVRSGRPWFPRKTSLSKGYKLGRLDPDNPLAFHLNGSPYIFERNDHGKVDKLHMQYHTFYKKR